MNGVVVHGITREEASALWAIAAKHGLGMQVGAGWDAAWPCTAFVDAGPRNAGGIPWELLGVGFQLLQKWDVLAPLGPEAMTTEELGTESERRRARTVAGDLRQPVYAPDLLLVNEAGRAFLACWQDECLYYTDERLAFTVALHRVKPRVCTLPRSWLVRGEERVAADKKWGGRRATPLVQVEVARGRFVRCRPGEEEATRRAFALRSRPRGGRGG